MTSFLTSNADVRERFRQQFKKPRLDVQVDLLAPPQSKRFTQVGTAFDYLLRFHVKRLNPDAIERPWVAESGFGWPLHIERLARDIIEVARKDYSFYLASGDVTDDLLGSALRLAQLDGFRRSGYIDENLGAVHVEDVADLRRLSSIVDPALFAAKSSCHLNPAFGVASMMVGGADADLVLDDLLIEIKTTQKLDFTTAHFHQLMGYVVLNEINLESDLCINKAGVYFARHGYLHTFDLGPILDDPEFPDLVAWFEKKAAQQGQQPNKRIEQNARR